MGVWICRREGCEHYGEPGWAVCSDCGHQEREMYVPEATHRGAVEALRDLDGQLAAVADLREHIADVLGGAV